MSQDVENTSTKHSDRRQQSRRQFLKAAASLGISAAGASLLGSCGSPAATPTASQETLETTRIRLVVSPVICNAPSYLAEDNLKAEGFSDIQYTKIPGNLVVKPLTTGEADFAMQYSGPLMIYVDTGQPIVMLAGVHVGCFELFGTERVHTILDLKGKTLAITEMGGPEHVFLSSMASYVGLDPITDINWITHPVAESKQLFTDGKIDAFLAFPPVAQELRAKKIGHLVVSSMVDKPWSQYFCCMITGNREFVQAHPVATKRAVRAILKATDLCALQPARAAQMIVDKGYADNYDYVLAAMQDIPYNRWREYDPNDTLRFFALRLHEGGMVKAIPDEIIARGADWRFLNEIKKEKFASLEFMHQFQRAQRSSLCQIDV